MELKYYDPNPIKCDPDYYYKPSRLIKYEERGKLVLYALGGRRIGKSYSIIRDKGMKPFVESGGVKQFLYIRRHMTDYANMETFFDRYTLVKSEPEYIREGWTTKPDGNQGGSFLYKGKQAGFYSTILKMNKKGSEYPNVDTIIFDEFIPQQGEKLLADEYNSFFAMVLSVCNYIKPVHVYMLANVVSLYNPYLLNIGYMYYGQEFWTKEDPNQLGMANASVVQYCKTDPRLLNVFQNSPWGRALYGTKYGDHALYNESLSEDSEFIAKKSRFSKCVFCFLSEATEFSVWLDMLVNPYVFYVSKSKPSDNVEHYVLNYKERGIGYKSTNELMRLPMWQALTHAYDNGYVYYENAVCQGAMLELLKKGWRI